jgi:phospholipase/carboxylesterase
MHKRILIESGAVLDKASSALIMLHGRGATAQSILTLADYFRLDDFYIVAPQATNNTWYPKSFLSPTEENEPWLGSAIELVHSLIQDIINAGISSDKIYLMGFSQGACLTLEVSTRYAQRWGGVIAFTGGLIGDKLKSEHYNGNFKGTRVFIGNSDQDPHVPLSRSEESASLIKNMGADVKHKTYPGMPHTIIQDEIEVVSELFFPD